MKLLATSAVFPTWKMAHEQFAKPYMGNPKYYVDVHMMHGVGCRVIVYERQHEFANT